PDAVLSRRVEHRELHPFPTRRSSDLEEDLPLQWVEEAYDSNVEKTRNLMLAKNHDYGEAWRDMRISSLTDLILTKLHRVKQIERSEEHTSELQSRENLVCRLPLEKTK